MKKISKNILTHLSRSRRHQWKYVSPRRRKFGLFILAILLGLFYAAWYVTRDSFIRRKAEDALEQLMATDVDAESADFSLEEGIRLYNVKVWYPRANTGAPYFFAEEVVLYFSAWKALLNSRVEPSRIVCTGCTMSGEYSLNEKYLNYLSKHRDSARDQTLMNLPHIELKDARRRMKKGHWNLYCNESLNCSLLPSAEDKYTLTVGDSEERRSADEILAKFEFNVRTSEIKPVYAKFPLDRMIASLPPWMRDHAERYRLGGRVSIDRQVEVDPEQVGEEWDGPAWLCRLEGLSMKLPAENGGLRLSDVEGNIYFTEQTDQDDKEECILLRDFRGIIKEMGNAPFVLQGKYGGYGQESHFNLDISIRQIALPTNIDGPLKEIIATIRRRFKPEGPIDLDLSLVRNKEHRRGFRGTARVRSSSMAYILFPLPVENPSGTLTFTEKGVDGFKFAAERGDTRFAARGVLWEKTGVDGNLFRVNATADNILLDAALKSALGESQYELWDCLHPRGRCSVDVTVSREASSENGALREERHLVVRIRLDGFASLDYRDFPFPLKKLSGTVTYRDGTITIHELVSRAGKMICNIQGTISDIAGTPLMNIEIVSNQVPLDENLFSVLGKRSGALVNSLKPRGMARRIDASIFRKKASEKLGYSASAEIEDLSFEHDSFPIRVTNAAGRLVLESGKLVIDSIDGRLDTAEGKTDISIKGAMNIAAGNPSYNIDITGENLLLTRQVYDAVPPGVKEAWDSISPRGRVNISLNLRSDEKGGQDYRLGVHTGKMNMKPSFFPVAFRNVSGSAVITPGLVELKKVRIADGARTVLVNGQIQLGERGSEADLSLSVRRLPVDRELLSALPSAAGELFQMLKEGGELDMDLGRLRFYVPEAAEKQAPALRTTRDWIVDGTVVLRDCHLDLGFSPVVVSGRFSGEFAGKNGSVSVNADTRLNSLKIKKHVFNRLQGTLKKDFDSAFLHVGSVEADFYGGRIIGKGDLQLSDEPVFIFSSQIKNVEMSRLVNSWSEGSKKKVPLSGKLTGSLAAKLVSGKSATSMAQGEIAVSQGNLYKLPVIVGLLNVIYLSLPGESAFDRGFVTYYLKEGTLRFTEIYLTGQSVSILGSGTLDIQSEKLDLTFLTGPPGKLPRKEDLAIEVMRSISRELIQIKVRGTLKNPNMDTVPLQSLNTLLRRLLEPSRKTH